MMIMVENEYLEFNEDVELERKVKLFEEISGNEGDLSFQFEIYLSANNRRILSFPYPDNKSKRVYKNIPADLFNDQNNIISRGNLRVERIVGDTLFCSFFSGNSNWFSELSNKLSDIDFSDLSEDQTLSNIIASKARTEGIIWPIVDNGGLVTRSWQQMMVEDFVPGIYVKTIFKRIFQKHSIKIQGELIEDPIFNTMTTHKNIKSNSDIEALSSFVQKTSTTARPGENVPYKIAFDNDSVYPYYDGSMDAFDLANSRYITPYRMRVRIEASMKPSIVDSSYNNRIYIYINGVFTFVDIGLDAGGLYNQPTAGDQDNFILDRTITIEAGDVVELYAEWQQSGGSTQNDVLSGSVKFTPIYIYYANASYVVPNWTQQEYVSNILRLFNVLTCYDSTSKVLTLNLFEHIKYKDPIDISNYVSSNEVDYSEFISNYGKRNLFSYNNVDFEDLRDYNVTNFFKYGEGSIDADNDFLEDSQDVVQSDFSNPLGYINSVFDMSMEKIDVVSLNEDTSTNVTSVTDSGGIARFNLEEDIYLVGELVRLKDMTNLSYNGDWIVKTRGTGYVEFFGLPYDTTATGSSTRLIHEYNESDDVYLMINVPDYDVEKFSGLTEIFFGDDAITSITNHSLSFFSLLNTGRQINDDYKQSLSFGEISSPFFYQRTMLETYWTQFGRIINDPVLLKNSCYLPYVVYDRIDFMSPLYIKTLESSNLYYCNRISGYKNSYDSCLVELIKLP